MQLDLSVEQATALSVAAKALADPTRLRIVDVVLKSVPEAVCQCELVTLFAGVAKHRKVLVDAGILASDRRGTWTYYYARPGATENPASWLLFDAAPGHAAGCGCSPA